MDTNLPEEKRTQLDGIVKQMIQNKESDSNIRFVVNDFKTKYTPTAATENTAQTADKASADKFNPTFPSSSDEGVIGGTSKVVGNIPSSSVHFLKGVANFFNPVNTVKNTIEAGKSAFAAGKEGVSGGAIIKEIPHEAYKQVVPTFLQNIFSGDLEEARRTIENDPVGQIAPLILMARATAENLGKGAEFDAGMSKLASPITKVASKVTEGAGNLAAQTLGATTGTGASSVKTAFNAASEGPDSVKSFTDALRGKTNPEDVVQSVQDAVENIKTNRRTSYTEKLAQIGEDKSSHDITPVNEALDTQLKNFGVKVGKDGELDFSRSSIAKTASARADIQGVYDTVKEWGSKSGDRTGIGLDLLQKQLSDFYSPSGQARAFVQGVLRPVKDILGNEVTGYKDMTSGYSKASQLLDDIKSATGAGSKAKVDTVFTKLTTAMKADKELRLEILKQIESSGEQPNLMEKIAGTNMQSFIPKGLVGKGADIGALYAGLRGVFTPQFIPLLLSTSPRIVGEFVRALGIGAEKTKAVLSAINKAPSLVIPPSQSKPSSQK